KSSPAKPSMGRKLRHAPAPRRSRRSHSHCNHMNLAAPRGPRALVPAVWARMAAMSQPPLAVVPAGAGSVSPGSSPPVRVLVVDDETLTARTLVRMVRHFGHEAVVAQTIEQAITSFDQTTFDVVLTDLNLGAWSGFDLLRHIRDRAPEIPVVLLTGYATI